MDGCGRFGFGRGVLISVARRGETETMALWTSQILLLLMRRRSLWEEVVKRLGVGLVGYEVVERGTYNFRCSLR